MLKKLLLLGIVSIMSLATVNAGQNFSTPKYAGAAPADEQFVADFIKSIALRNSNALWGLISVNSRQLFINQCGSEYAAKAQIMTQGDIFWNQLTSFLTQLYATPGDFRTMTVAILDENPQLLWQAVAPQAKSLVLTKLGSEYQAIQVLKNSIPQLKRQLPITVAAQIKSNVIVENQRFKFNFTAQMPNMPMPNMPMPNMPMPGNKPASKGPCSMCKGTGFNRYSYIEAPTYGSSPTYIFCNICGSKVRSHTHNPCFSCR